MHRYYKSSPNTRGFIEGPSLFLLIYFFYRHFPLSSHSSLNLKSPFGSLPALQKVQLSWIGAPAHFITLMANFTGDIGSPVHISSPGAYFVHAPPGSVTTSLIEVDSLGIAGTHCVLLFDDCL